MENQEEEDYRTCPYCGQNKIPFKMGVCICGKQVGTIQYIKNTGRFARNNYYTYGDTAWNARKRNLHS